MKYPSRIIMTHDEYHKCEAVGSSGLRTIIQQSPAHYLHNLMNPSEPTAAMNLGTAIHQAILEPLKFADSALIIPDFGDLRSSKNREQKESWILDNHGKLHLKKDEYEQISGILGAIQASKTARAYLSEGAAEDSIFWVDTETGIPCKGRFDFRKDNHILIDVKSTIDASFFAFQKVIANMNYDMQAAHYLDGATEVFGHVFDQYVIIAVEKSAPYGINCFVLTDETIQEGRSKNQQALKILKKCRETGIYPCYPDETKPIWLPSWAIKGDQDE